MRWVFAVIIKGSPPNPSNWMGSPTQTTQRQTALLSHGGFSTTAQDMEYHENRKCGCMIFLVCVCAIPSHYLLYIGLST